MYEVTISINGVLQKQMISANNEQMVYNIITNMYGNGNIQIINVRRI